MALQSHLTIKDITSALIIEIKYLFANYPNRMKINIQAPFAQRFKYNETADTYSINRSQMPSVQVTLLSALNEEVGLGRFLVHNTDGDNRWKGTRYSAVMQVDVWTENVLLRDQICSMIARWFWQNKSKMRRLYGIIDMTLQRIYERGFDEQDRILQFHSHQDWRAHRKILEFFVQYEETWNEFYAEAEDSVGTIDSISIKARDSSDTLYYSGDTLGGISVSLIMARQQFGWF